MLEELKRHNRVMESYGIYLAPYIVDSAILSNERKNASQRGCSLTECLSPWIAMGRRDDPYSMAKRLITMTVIGAEENDDNKVFVYVKGCEKRE